MILMALFSWWYGAGWSRLATRIAARINGVLAFFSVGLLLRTLFDPFRQIGSGKVNGPIGVQFRAWGDRMFSRAVGFVVRSIMIFVGLFAVLFFVVIGVIQLVLWPLVPILPVFGIILTAVGVK